MSDEEIAALLEEMGETEEGFFQQVEDDERHLKYLPQIALELASFNFNCPGRGH